MSSFYFIEETSSTSISGTMSFMHCHDAYELYFLLDGKKNYLTPTSLYNIEKNTLVITPPQVLHEFDSGPYRRILITLSPDLLSPSQCEFLNILAKKDIITFSDKSMDSVKKMLIKMLKVFNTPTKDSSVIFFLTLGRLFAYIHTHGKQLESHFNLENKPQQPTVTPTIIKVLDYVQKHFTQKISLNFLSKEFGISKTWLIKCFADTTQMTVIQYKLSLQLNKAKNLLVSTNKSIEQISKECGFSSANYFGMIFKRHVGVSPKNYGKQNIKLNLP